MVIFFHPNVFRNNKTASRVSPFPPVFLLCWPSVVLQGKVVRGSVHFDDLPKPAIAPKPAKQVGMVQVFDH